MSSLETFGRTLSETIGGEKLSASRVERVRDVAVEQFHRGEKTASIMIKVHRKASRRTKLSSLYVFDAICRYAAQIVRKGASGFDYRLAEAPAGSQAERGTKQALLDSSSSFLRFASDVLAELVTSTLEAVREDQQAKVAKVVDIWIKAGTFDDDVLRRVKESLHLNQSSNQGTSSTNGQGGQDANSIPSPYGMLMRDESSTSNLTPPAGTNTPPSHIPANLLALLGGGKSKESVETRRSELEGAGLDASQLAMLQQIAQQNNRQGNGGAEAPAQGSSGPAAAQSPPTVKSAAGGPVPPPFDPPSKSAPSAAAPSHQPPSAIPPAGPAPTQSNPFVPNQSIGDLSHFDMSRFDPTNASHWLQFAQHWHNTYQYIPSNQELMWAMMSAMQSHMYAAANFDGSSW